MRAILKRLLMPDIAEYKRRINLLAFLTDRLGFPPSAGATYKWNCPHPTHLDLEASFTYTPTKDPERFYCFGLAGACELRSGDVLDFLMKVDGLSFGEARARLRGLAAKYARGPGVEVPRKTVGSSVKAPTATPQKGESKAPVDRNEIRKWRDIAEAVIKEGERNIETPTRKVPGYETALEYLTGPERMLKPETIRAARLGFIPAKKFRSFKNYGKATRAVVFAGVVIPCIINSEVIYVKFRIFNQRDPGDRYRYLKKHEGIDKTLFCGPLIAERERVVVVEGEFDTLLGNQEAGDLAAFVTAGFAGADPGPFAENFKERTVLLIPDCGEAGERWVELWVTMLKNVGVTPRVLDLPVGADLTECVSAGGDVRALLENAGPP